MLIKDYVLSDVTEDPNMSAIFDAEQKEIDNYNLNIQDVLNQCFIDTATWGLNMWEELLEIPTDKTKSYSLRRDVIKASLRGYGTVTRQLLIDIASTFTDGKVELFENVEPFVIEIKFNDSKGLIPGIDDLYEIINKIKPAHIVVRYKFSLKKSVYFGSCTRSGEKITVYPWSPKEIVTKGKITIPMTIANSIEEIKVYPKGDV